VHGDDRNRTEAGVVVFLAFVTVPMAYGIDALLPAFDQLRVEFDLDERNLSPAILVTAYFVGMAVGQLAYGVLADRFGRRPVLLLGVSVYAAGALAAALAPNLELLLAARLLWGLGAAAPLVMRTAIARDLFDGDAMARVITTVTAVFLVGPIVMPLIGEAILLVGDWRAVVAAALVLAVFAFMWTIRFGETLAPQNQRPLRFGPFREAVVAVVRTRTTLWAIIAQTFFGAAFFVWLGSAQPILDSVYGRDSQFAVFFGMSGIGMAVALLLNRRLIARFGTRKMALRAATVFVIAGAIGLAVALAADGVPSVWAWFVWAVVANSMSTIMTPMSAALALEPMADKAGTASAILGTSQLGIGALLAAIVDAQIDDTVTPMLVGALLFGVFGLASLSFAVGSSSKVPKPG
jgi:DHA1 family bicyclomycin/chloramphenicol resistance-like MFS transporter